MEKIWQSPEIQVLNLEETFGGPKYDPAADGAIEWDEEHKYWKEPLGKES